MCILQAFGQFGQVVDVRKFSLYDFFAPRCPLVLRDAIVKPFPPDVKYFVHTSMI